VDIHPVGFNGSNETIVAAGKAKPEWIKKSFNIPSDTATFKALSSKLIGDATTVRDAAKRVHDYVYGSMKPNAGIGVLRDATEILKTKEGVCRDYAVLTATLLRSGGVPSRLVSGLVYEEGSFYYHAWVEVWDGNTWVGVDSTLPSGKLTAGHIQLAQGNVEEAFTFTFLDRVKVEVLDARRT
jgi:transglutaminase-like putative cysteine protease